MKAITLWQPWASLVAMGIKTYETRSWGTNYRGPLAIHAGKKVARWQEFTGGVHGWLMLHFEEYRHAATKPEGWPTGVILATVNLVDVTLIDPNLRQSKSWQQRLVGDFSDGRFAWKFEDIVPMDSPIVAKGHQRLWEWDGMSGI